MGNRILHQKVPLGTHLTVNACGGCMHVHGAPSCTCMYNSKRSQHYITSPHPLASETAAVVSNAVHCDNGMKILMPSVECGSTYQ